MAVKHSMYNEPGRVAVDDFRCVLCGRCVEICPSEVFTIDSGKLLVNNDNFFGCITCCHCSMVCPHDAISVSGRGTNPDDIIALPLPEQRASAASLEALMLSRRSIRHFSDKPVDRELIDRILDMASSAPMGIPPWDVGCTVVMDKGQLQDLKQEIIKGYQGLLKIFRPWLLKLFRPLIGKDRYEMFNGFLLPLAQAYVHEYQLGRDVLFYDAPAVLIFHHWKCSDPTDASIACTYAMLAAESLGLGTTMIGAAAPILQRNKKLCKKLRIPESNKPSIVLIVGHPSVEFVKSVKRNFSSIEII